MRRPRRALLPTLFAVTVGLVTPSAADEPPLLQILEPSISGIRIGRGAVGRFRMTLTAAALASGKMRVLDIEASRPVQARAQKLLRLALFPMGQVCLVAAVIADRQSAVLELGARQEAACDEASLLHGVQEVSKQLFGASSQPSGKTTVSKDELLDWRDVGAAALPGVSEIPSAVKLSCGQAGDCGELRLNTLPWTHVIIDGKRKATTPLVLTLESGEHEIFLYNSRYDVDLTIRIVIEPGLSKTVALRLAKAVRDSGE